MTPAHGAAMEQQLRDLARGYSTVNLAAFADRRGLREDDVAAAARRLGLQTYTRAGATWVHLSARRPAKWDEGDR